MLSIFITYRFLDNVRSWAKTFLLSLVLREQGGVYLPLRVPICDSLEFVIVAIAVA